ncbi:class II glutamine amidotransferase [Nocardia sp. NPDC059691]|uniref:class II glutamine amidotransferase n=1 Tax=Nocardia sp. NPDC059691 TaxID=3346908 RepID=UPI0036BC085C
MCILTFVKPGISPDLDALTSGALANPHGHGYAVLTDTGITVGRGMDAEEVITEFATVRERHPEGAALFHSRLATHGHLTVDNCHPFLVGGDERTVLAHNGILPDNVHPTSGDQRSDTRITAEDFLPTRPFGSLDSAWGRKRLERWLGGDKMVILTVDPTYKHSAYIFNEHYGHWDSGSWYSNHTYQSHTWRYSAAADWDSCLHCGELDPNQLGPHCTACGFCAECLRPFPRCDCAAFDGTDRYADLIELETA